MTTLPYLLFHAATAAYKGLYLALEVPICLIIWPVKKRVKERKREREKVSVDLAAAAAGVAYKERLNMPVIPYEVELPQPAALREYFRERVIHHRQQSQRLPKGTDTVFQKEAKE
ncbi:MAG: DNA polymerase III subunit theta [Pantoea agglomerans]